MSLEEKDVLVVVNANDPESVALAQDYRGIHPEVSTLDLPLPLATPRNLPFAYYDEMTAIRRAIWERIDAEGFRCVLMTRGTPYDLWDNGTPTGYNSALDSWLWLREDPNWEYEREFRPNGFYRDVRAVRFGLPDQVLISRIDGPTLSDCQIMVERSRPPVVFGLRPVGVIDARGLPVGSDYYPGDADLLTAAEMLSDLGWDVLIDKTKSLLEELPPGTNLYAGWYGSEKPDRRPADEEVPWIGWHLISNSATDIRKDTTWVGWLVRNRVLATLGAVAEPYLAYYTKTELMVHALLKWGWTLAEAFAYSTPLAAWRMLLVGDPLLRIHYVPEVRPALPPREG